MARRDPPTPQTPFYPGEVHDIPFRFEREMTPDETIVQVTPSCVSVGTTVDASPMQRVATAHEVVDRTTVVQRFETAAAGTQYVVMIEATLSSGRVFIAAALVSVINPLPT